MQIPALPMSWPRPDYQRKCSCSSTFPVWARCDCGTRPRTRLRSAELTLHHSQTARRMPITDIFGDRPEQTLVAGQQEEVQLLRSPRLSPGLVTWSFTLNRKPRSSNLDRRATIKEFKSPGKSPGRYRRTRFNSRLPKFSGVGIVGICRVSRNPARTFRRKTGVMAGGYTAPRYPFPVISSIHV